jgi:regulator of PEP synthase PpsR (kinase-PPPase family)
VLVGVSRTSKTPTSIYLANRGVKAGNLPVIPDCPLPVELGRLTRPLIVGLTINPELLVQIRKNRLRQLGSDDEVDAAALARFGGDYAELERVKDEVVHARRLFARQGWPVIDVTRRSVEETAAAIFQLLQARRAPDLQPSGTAEAPGAR